MYTRILAEEIRKSSKSTLLLGPRQTGKSTLLKSLNPDLTVNLAHEPTYLRFLGNPSELEETIASNSSSTVFIDEVQRIPSLLNTIQYLIDEKRHTGRFLISGSSARKLRRGHANLLPGRVFVYRMTPLITAELDYAVNEKAALSTGCLPGVYSEKEQGARTRILRGYAATYLKEEIQAEALSRNLEGFVRFLNMAAATAGQFLDLAKLGSAAQIRRPTAVRYFEVLEDTLIVSRCEPYARSEKTRLVQHPRYFFFDTGVLNGILGNFIASEERKGLLFEHLVYNQIQHSCQARDIEFRLSTFRTAQGAEVDFILELGGETWAIEVKASANVGAADLRGLESFTRLFGGKAQRAVATLGGNERKRDGVWILPWQSLLKKIGL